MTKLKTLNSRQVLHFPSIEPGQKNISVIIFRLHDRRFFQLAYIHFFSKYIVQKQLKQE